MKILVANTKQELVDHFLVRGQVFIVGQQIDWDIEFDGLDGECVLFNVYLDDVCVGAARLYHNKLGRLATLEAYRNQGIATKLMAYIEYYAQRAGLDHITLHAQYYVKDYYERRGYHEVGDIFQEAEIDHIKMIKQL